MWSKIDQIKSIFCEPRSGRKEGGSYCRMLLYRVLEFSLSVCTSVYVLLMLCLVDFEEAISSYYQVIAESTPTNQESRNGESKENQIHDIYSPLLDFVVST